MRRLSFALDMDPPRTTHQEHEIKIAYNKQREPYPVVYKPEKLKRVEAEYMFRLAKYRPKEPFNGPIKLEVDFAFPTKVKKKFGTFKTTKPDTDNMIKMLKDCMTKCGFWHDDAQVAVEIIRKHWEKDGSVVIIITEME